MTVQQIKDLQKRIGTVPDGYWGPKSIAACQRHLKALSPAVSPWPLPNEAALQAFYGSPGDESKLVNLPTPFPMFFDGKRVKTIRCHFKVAASLDRALADAYRTDPKVVSIYDGCFNNRPMRGGSSPSLHARGAAIDLDAGPNGNKVHWPTAAVMPITVMEAFSREGWTCAGAAWGRDSMHTQASR